MRGPPCRNALQLRRGQEALFHLLIDRAFLEARCAPPPTLPVPTPPAGATLARLRERLAADARLPRLDVALSRRRVSDPREELEGIVRELYALIERTRRAITLIERSALDLPDFAQLFYGEIRRDLVSRLERYVESRTRRGYLRSVPDPPAAARLLLENVACFAMHRHRDPDPAGIADDVARETVVHFILNALTPAPAPRPGKAREARP
jgi:hypothetical protein